MDYEEKYNAALERAKKLQETCDSTAVVGWCEYIFPELKESEDVRIKKTLIAFFRDWERTKSHCWNVNVSDIIAWLEKQGENKKLDADKVIEWLKTHGNLVPVVTIRINEVIAKFKEDFGL